MNDGLPLISVIVPIYNTKEYLDACIGSIVEQTYRNLEIILVDDGSTDGSGEACDAWRDKDARIRVIHKQNGGQAEARNVGIAEAAGAYIGFVDSDDFVSPVMYERLMELSAQNRADVAGCDAQLFWEEPFTGFETGESEIRVFNNKDGVKSIFGYSYFDSTVWNLLVKGEIARKVKFDVGKIHEDILWVYRVLREAECSVYTSEKLYAYYQRPGSTMNAAYSRKRFDALDALQQRAEEIKTDFPALYPLAERSYVGSCMYHYQMLCRMEKTKEYEEFKKILHRRFLDGDRKAAYSVVAAKQKMWYIMFASMPELTCRIRNTLGIGM